jgi:hypothetical protein
MVAVEIQPRVGCCAVVRSTSRIAARRVHYWVHFSTVSTASGDGVRSNWPLEGWLASILVAGETGSLLLTVGTSASSSVCAETWANASLECACTF